MGILESEPVDLVISDIHMGGLSGVELLERAQEIDPQILVILMTGKPTVDTAVRSLKANAYDYLTKPFDLDEFFAVVDRALEKQRLTRENAALKSTLTLYQISQAVNASVDEREVVEMVLGSVREELGAESVALFVEEGGRLERWDGEEEDAAASRCERALAEKVVEGEDPLLVQEEDPDAAELLDGFRSGLAIPLRRRDRTHGAIAVLRQTGPRGFTRGDVQTATILAGNIATVMENARQTRLVMESRAGLLEANTSTIGALVSALDAREHETQIHSIRVTEFALRLAREVGFPADELVDLKFGAMLHDIGKIGVADRILLKAGPLTDEEWREMRRHPVIGYRILREIRFLRKASEIVLAHHERFDGTGYPRGLEGDRIPLGARLFAVADTYDSMTHDRPYRAALEYEDVVAELNRCRGTQFDPEVVDTFLAVPRAEWEAISQRAANQRFAWSDLFPPEILEPPRE